MQTRYIAFLFALIPVIGFISIERNLHDNTALAKGNNKKKHKPNKLVEIPQDRNEETGIVIGNKNSPHELILFSSLTCSGCKKFHKTILPEILQQFKDLKIRLEFYIDSAPALETVKMINIKDLTVKQKMNIIEAYFENQKKIDDLQNKAKIYFIHDMVEDLGIAKADIKKASADEALAKEILAHFKQVSNSTTSEYLPTLIMNKETYKGSNDSLNEIKKFIKAHI